MTPKEQEELINKVRELCQDAENDCGFSSAIDVVELAPDLCTLAEKLQVDNQHMDRVISSISIQCNKHKDERDVLQAENKAKDEMISNIKFFACTSCKHENPDREEHPILCDKHQDQFERWRNDKS